jgi:hemerythrin
MPTNISGAPPFSWNEKMETGVEVIDTQHQHLLEMVNDSYKKIREATTPETFQRLAKELLNYAIYHFQTEESLMQESGYLNERTDEAELHINDHRKFSEKITALRGVISANDEAEIISLLEFLQDWIQRHTLEMDVKLGNYISQKNIEIKNGGR